MSERYIGLMSGTSMDGNDAVLVTMDGDTLRVEAALCHPWPEATARELHALCTPGENEIDRMGVADRLDARQSILGGARYLAELLARFEAVGVRKVMAVIGDSANVGSIGVHSAVGFERVGVVKSCGWKFDRWLDIVLMEKSLGAGDSSRPE